MALLALLAVLVATDTALSVWQRLSEAPAWLRYGYLAVVLAVSVAAVYLAWRWLAPRRPQPRKAKTGGITEEALRRDAEDLSAQGVDVEAAREELREQARRRVSGEVHIAVFGEVSAGKSSVVRALLPDARVDVDARAGSTREIRHHHWQAESGDRVLLADLPGFNFDEDPAILEEARRAHLVVFLCEGDLTASQFSELDRLKELGKPVILAINKADRYEESELRAISERIAGRSGLPRGRVVAIRSGGRQEVIRMLSDGSEQAEIRERPSDVEPLREAIQACLDEDLELMEQLRETAVLLLAAEKLDRARQHHREQEADRLVRLYSRRAVIGALAAVAPGSDLVIQGVLATRLVQELCALYGVSVKEVQVESFLKLAGGKVRKMSALTLAIAGNALKAFPGLGTLSGGLLHAVAYGMIFDSLGRAAAVTLATRGELRPAPAAAAFEERLRENLETGAGRFAKLALSQRGRPDPS